MRQRWLRGIIRPPGLGHAAVSVVLGGAQDAVWAAFAGLLALILCGLGTS